MSKRIYLDYASATPLLREVSVAMHRVEKNFSNPSGLYQSSREVSKIINSAKKSIAMQIGANASEIVFTSGATEANNLAILGVVQEEVSSGEIISIGTEHSSVREPLNHLSTKGIKIIDCKITKTGRVDLEDFKSKLDKKTKLVTITYANSEIGTIQDIAKISQIIKKFNSTSSAQILFHSDCSAAINSLSCNMERLGLDLATFSGAKIYGPKNIGVLYIRRGTKIEPIMYGGGQQNGLRPGSEDVISIVGFSKALEIVNRDRKEQASKYRELYTKLIHQLQGNVEFIENGDPKKRIYNVLNISFAGVNGENLVAYLDSVGIEVSTGAACEISNDTPSPVLLALGIDSTLAQGNLRISFGRNTTHKDLDYLIDKLKSVIKDL